MKTLRFNTILLPALLAPTLAMAQEVPVADAEIDTAALRAEVSAAPISQSMEAIAPDLSPDLRWCVEQFLSKLEESYPHMEAAQRELVSEASFKGRALSKEHSANRYRRMHEELWEPFNYIRQTKGHNRGFGFFVNAAPASHGGQRGYLVNLRSGDMLEVPVSTAWRGVGYTLDSDKTPLGYFMIEAENAPRHLNAARTIVNEPTDLFRKMEKQNLLDFPKWLRRVDTRKEKAYILSNQFALHGQNDGNEFVPMAATRHYFGGDSASAYIDNANSLMRHLYVHGTNREEQLGFALSGGCVRVSNAFSYLLQEVYNAQGAIPVFIDAIKLHEPVQMDSPDLTEDEIAEDMETYDATVGYFGGLSQVDFYHSSAEKAAEVQIVAPAVEAFVLSTKNKVKVTVSAATPLPESAIRAWLRLKDDPLLSESYTFRHTFDLRGRYAKTPEHDPVLDHALSLRQTREMSTRRNLNVKRRITQRIEEELKGFELDLADFSENLTFEFEQVEASSENGPALQMGFAVSFARQRVLNHLEALNDLAHEQPEAFGGPELNWIESYLGERVQRFTRKGGGREFVDEITYDDALLAQAYLLAIGEMELRDHANQRSLINGVEDESFYSLYPLGEPETLAAFDKAGVEGLARFSNGSKSRLGDAMLFGAFKKPNQRILGIILASEEYFSRYKLRSNYVRIRKSVQYSGTL